MSSGPSRSLSDLFSRFGSRRTNDTAVATAASDRLDDAPVFGTKALRKLFSSLRSSESPVLLDLGPVVGSNVTYFGEKLGCKIFVEDIYADLERFLRQGKVAELAGFLARRFPQGDASVDGILCWDLIDYLDRASAQMLATELTRLLRVDGVLLGFFSTTQSQDLHYTKYIIVDDVNLKHRTYPATRPRQRAMQNRDIIKLFEGLRVTDSFLLQTNLREILFRKPAYLGAMRATI